MITYLKNYRTAGTYGTMETVAGTERSGEVLLNDRFQRSPYLPLRNIKCSLRDGVLWLCGRVPTFYLKQLAQSMGTCTEGVRQVVNELHVDFPDRS